MFGKMKISNYKKLTSGSMECSFCVTMVDWHEFEIRGLTVFNSNGRRWVNLPSREYMDKETNKKKYYMHNGFAEKDRNEAFKTALLNALDESLKVNTKEDDGLPF